MAVTLKTFSIAIDTKVALYGRLALVEGDTGNRFVITLTDDGAAVDLSACRVAVVFSGPMGTAMQDSWSGTGYVSIGGTSHNVITVDLLPASYATGLNTCEIQVYSGESYTTLITSAQFTFNARKPIVDADTIASSTEYPILISLINQVEALTDREQADWDQADDAKGTYIKNKPVIGADIQAPTNALTAETTLSDADTVPFYDASASAHRKSTWANIVSKIRAALFGSTTGVLKADGAGNVSAAAANTDFAAASHASRHAIGGPDATARRFTATFLAGGWDEVDGVYRQTISVAGMTVDMKPKCDILFDDEDDLEDRIAQKEAWLLVDDVDSSAGTVTLTCFDDAPEVAFTIQMEVIL